jgi:hypothetical protein
MWAYAILALAIESSERTRYHLRHGEMHSTCKGHRSASAAAVTALHAVGAMVATVATAATRRTRTRLTPRR